MRPSFAKCLNSPTSYADETVLQKLTHSSGIWMPGDTGSGSEPHLEALLNGMIVNGLARTAPLHLQSYTCRGCGWCLLALLHAPRRAGLWNRRQRLHRNRRATWSFFKPHLRAIVQGYGYSAQNVAIKLALAVLILQASIASTFIVVIGWSRLTSTSWNTPSEVLALCVEKFAAPE